MMKPPELDADVRALIDAARGGHDPSELNRARVRKGVEVKLATGVALAIGPAASAFAGLKVAVSVVAVASVVGAGIYAVPRLASRRAPAPAPAARVVEPAPALAPVPAIPDHVPAPVASTPRAPKRRAVAPAPVTTPSASSLKEETALLGAANAALGRGDVTRARAALAEYDRRPGPPMLAEERAVTGILISCAAGRDDDARAQARRFRARWPRSPLVARVDASCAAAR